MADLEKVVDAINALKIEQAGLSTTVGNLVEQIRKQNGSVTTLFKQMHELEQEVKTHPGTCIMRDKIGDLETKILTGQLLAATDIGQRMSTLEQTTTAHLNDVKSRTHIKQAWRDRYLFPIAKWATILMITAIGLSVFEKLQKILEAAL